MVCYHEKDNCGDGRRRWPRCIGGRLLCSSSERSPLSQTESMFFAFSFLFHDYFRFFFSHHQETFPFRLSFFFFYFDVTGIRSTARARSPC